MTKPQTRLNEAIKLFENDFKSLKDELMNLCFAKEMYSALCNMQWENIEDPGLVYSCSWRYAGGLIAKIRNKNEDYLDFYCGGNEGKVSPDVRKCMRKLGWKPKPYPKD